MAVKRDVRQRSVVAAITVRCTSLLVLLTAVSVCVVPNRDAVAQIYRPIANNNMWDSYLFRDGDDYHLFYLQNENYPRVDPDRPSWLLASVGRAVSRDLIHWETLPPVDFRSFKNDFEDSRHMFIGQATAK